MKLISLALSNYRQHKESAIRFQEGIIGILGANGSGKSSVLEAIAYALYGPHAAKREGRAEGILWQRAPGKSDVEVVLTFELLGETYTIERRLKQARLFKGASIDGTLLKNGPNEVTQHVEEGLGMDRETFFNSFFARQKELAFLATVKGVKRQELITRMLGLESIDRARQLVTEDRRNLKSRLEGKKAGLGDPAAIRAQVDVARLAMAQSEAQCQAAVAAHAAAAATLAEIRPQLALWNEKAQVKAAAETKREALAKEQQRLSEEHERQSRELGEIEALRPELARLTAQLAPLEQIRRQFAEQEALRGHEEQRQALLGQKKAQCERQKQAQAILDKAVAELAALGPAPDERMAQLQRELEAVNARISGQEKAHAAARQALVTELAQMRTQYKRVQERKRHLAAGKHQNCPTCLRPLGEGELPQVLDDFDAQLKALEVEGKRLKAASDELEAEPPELVADRQERARLEKERQELQELATRLQIVKQKEQDAQQELIRLADEMARLEQNLADVPAGYDASLHQALTVQLGELQPLEVQAGQLKSQVERRESLAERLQELIRQQVAVGQALAELNGQLEALDYRNDEHQRIIAEFQAVELAEREASDQRIKAEESVAGAKQLLAIYENQLIELEGRLAQVAEEEKELTYLELLEERFRSFRDRLNQEIRPQLSELASVYLAQLTDGRYTSLDIDDQYDIRVYDDGEAFPLERYSGGEQDVVNLCLRLAISQMIADRAGQPLTFIVLDEVFGSLDESRRDNVVGLLEALGHRFSQVILISHLEEIKQALHQVVRVHYDERAGHSVVAAEEGEAAEAGVPLGLPL